MSFLTPLTMKLIGAGVGLLAVLSFIGLSLHWKHEMTARGEKLEADCQATRDASGLPNLKCGDVPRQIEFMGEAIGSLSAVLKKQNEAVDALKATSDQQQAEAERAILSASKRVHAAEGQTARLEASSRAGERLTKPCLPSDTLKEAWK
jgi:hypothetical protein